MDTSGNDFESLTERIETDFSGWPLIGGGESIRSFCLAFRNGFAYLQRSAVLLAVVRSPHPATQLFRGGARSGLSADLID
jgi:hypothetical protein